MKNCTCARVSRCVKVEHSGQAECLLSRALGRSQGRSVGHKHRLHRIKSPRYLFSLTGQATRPIELETGRVQLLSRGLGRSKWYFLNRHQAHAIAHKVELEIENRPNAISRTHGRSNWFCGHKHCAYCYCLSMDRPIKKNKQKD